MTRMNATMRRMWYPRIVKKQGGSFCCGCGIKVHYQTDNEKEKKIGILDHVNNKFVNSEENLQIMCRSCNRIKNPSKKSIITLPITASEKKNYDCEKPFRGWLINLISENNGEYDYDDARDAGAEKFKCSPETTRKYIDKMKSSVGIINVEDGMITFKPDKEIDQWVFQDKLNVENKH